VSHCRGRAGEREGDLIVEGEDGRIVAIGVKLGMTVSDEDTRHLRRLRGQVADILADALVISAGDTAYRRSDGIAVVPQALFET